MVTWTPLRAVVLVEGNSDRVALQTLAERRGRDLAAEGIEVVAMGGITNTRAFASRYGPRGLGVQLAGLYDAPEAAQLRRGLAAAGLSVALEPDGPERLGFYGCSADLEDELIRALGVEAVEAVIERGGRDELAAAAGGHARPAGLDARGGAPAVLHVAVGAQGPLRGAAGRGVGARPRARAVGGGARPGLSRREEAAETVSPAPRGRARPAAAPGHRAARSPRRSSVPAGRGSGSPRRSRRS